MAARIGTDDVAFYEHPHSNLLRKVSGIEPEPSGTHVLLDKHAGVRSVQRLALGDVGNEIVVGLWPAELKPQAAYLYRDGRGQLMVATARSCGWDVRPSPHLAFFTSQPSRRLYMAPELSAEEYAQRWEGIDGSNIGEHSAADLRQTLWPWLKDRGYAASHDDPVLEEFLKLLGRRKAHLRPGMRFRRRWDRKARNERQLALAIRDDVNAILRAAGEPSLPASRVE